MGPSGRGAILLFLCAAGGLATAGGAPGASAPFAPYTLHGLELTASATRSVAGTAAASTCSLVVTTTADAGAGSLRAAIECADAGAGTGTATIGFEIGAGRQTISPASTLPALTQPTVLDGTTQPGFAGVPLIRLDGAGVAGKVAGLVLTAPGSTVRGLEITGWAGAGIELDGNDETISGSYVGNTGTVTAGNATGVYVPSGTGDTIGGALASDADVISGNTGAGIVLTGAAGNRIEGSYIGTDVTGAAPLPNTYGILVGAGATSNVVGGAVTADRNLISGNTQAGVDVFGDGTSDNIVEGNRIGTDAAGTAALPNAYGVLIGAGASSNTLGGTAAPERNLLSGNSDAGVELIGSGTCRNLVEGNRIGTGAAGASAVGNGVVGILVTGGASGNIIGGSAAGAGNLISGNGEGVTVSGSGTTGNRVEGNYVGTDAGGTRAIPNTYGVVVGAGANSNTVGGGAAADRNLISGNSDVGAEVSGTGTTGNVVEGNWIGTDVTGAAAIAKTKIGLEVVNGATDNTIGGAAAGAGNLVSGNGDGVLISGTGTAGNHVEGNYVGTNSAGTAALSNSDGVVVERGASSNVVGGTAVADGNLISGNFVVGVELSGAGTTGNRVEGNRIGTGAGGHGEIPNKAVGVIATGRADGNTIGGSSTGSGNMIAYGATGVEIVGPSQQDSVEENSIFGNSKAGIALIGGGDGAEVAPRLISIRTTGTKSTISGYVGSGTHRIEVFDNAACRDPAEGAVFLGSATTSSGRWSLTVPAPGAGHGITATATSSSNTSEFSACVAVTAARSPAILNPAGAGP